MKVILSMNSHIDSEETSVKRKKAGRRWMKLLPMELCPEARQ